MHKKEGKKINTQETEEEKNWGKGSVLTSWRGRKGGEN
jgi:hypothetical protein